MVAVFLVAWLASLLSLRGIGSAYMLIPAITAQATSPSRIKSKSRGHSSSTFRTYRPDFPLVKHFSDADVYIIGAC